MATELLDGPLDDEAVLRGNLRDLARANRWLGGARLSCRAVDSLLDGTAEARILDVGTGAADIPFALLADARRHGRTLSVTAVDSRTEIVAAARTAADDGHGVPAELVIDVADGRALPFADGSFDVGHASLVVHHLEPTDAVAFLKELRRVSRLGVVVNDLIRSRLTLTGVWLASRLFTTNRYTRHDAPLSARRAYTTDELREILAASDLRVVAEHAGLAGHRRALAAVHA
jgi:ubiquinone/menaquinone biosynthesis C-methylase UbiE